MKLRTRKAMVTDVPRMWELRRESILALAPRGMTLAQAEAWANSMAIEGMEQRFRDAECFPLPGFRFVQRRGVRSSGID